VYFGAGMLGRARLEDIAAGSELMFPHSRAGWPGARGHCAGMDSGCARSVLMPMLGAVWGWYRSLLMPTLGAV
jgi:hypothetical protein